MLEVFDRGGNVNTFRMDGDPTIEPFTERFENYLAGWTVTFDILVPNDMTVCGELITPAGCAVSTYTVQYTDGTLIESGTIPSGGSKIINVPLCEDATWELRDTDGTLLNSGSIVSGGSATITAPDASAVLKNTAGTTLSTTSIVSGGSEEITAPDATVNNSDSTYTLSVPSGSTETIPDSQINVNGVDQGDVVSVKTIDVNITDGTNPVTPDSVSLVGNTLTVVTPDIDVAVFVNGVAEPLFQINPFENNTININL
jgi:hypothetical protein